uniref:Putative lectin/glucanase superfamily protein n=1 Tax=viral metagenome TaxID=1070528 RepID=A0A6H1ZR47_9ZZZZ
MELLLPRVVAPARILPSYVKLDMAFGVGAGTTLYDKSRYRSHGAIVSTDVFWAAGLHGYCGNFSPIAYVEIPAAKTQLNFTSEKFSMIARIRIDDLTTWRRIFNRGLAGADGYQWYIHSTGRNYFRTSTALGDTDSCSAAGSILINTRYTVGVSRNGASVRVYINGVDSTTTAGVHPDPTTCARSAKIGIYDDLVSTPFDGKMEFLRSFGGVALSASEHLAWHNALK